MIEKVRMSNLPRVMTCAGALHFTNLPKRDDQKGREGSAAGEYLQALIEGRQPGTHASNGVPFDSDMEFYLRPIAEEILRKANGNPVTCEVRCDWGSRSGIKLTGKSDVSYEVTDGHYVDLYIDDLKWGWGLIESKDNWQTLAYGVGEVIRRGKAYRNVYLGIRQPRPHHEDGDHRVWAISYTELIAYKELIEARLDEVAKGEKTLRTSDKCYYCPAAGDACPAINKSFYKGIETAQEFRQDSMNEKELSNQLELIARVAEVIKIKHQSLEALAIDRIKAGKVIPGYVTEESIGHAKWKPGITKEALAAMTNRKVTTEDVISPNQLAKLGVDKEFIKTLTFRPSNGQKLKRKDGSDIGNKVFGTQQPQLKEGMING